MGWEEGSGGDIIVNSDLCLRVVHFFFVCVLKGVGKQADHDSFIVHSLPECIKHKKRIELFIKHVEGTHQYR